MTENQQASPHPSSRHEPDPELADGSSYRAEGEPSEHEIADGSNYRGTDDADAAREAVDPKTPTAEREPTGQTGSATEQYAGAGTTPDSEPELETKTRDD